MVRIVPRRTKVKLEFIRGFTGLDLLLAVIAVVVLILLAASNFPGHIWIAMVWAIFALSMFFKIADSDRFYVTIAHLVRFSMQKKKYEKAPKKGKPNIKNIIPFPVPSTYISADIVYPKQKPLKHTIKYTSSNPITVEPISHKSVATIILFFIESCNVCSSFISLFSFNAVIELVMYRSISSVCTSFKLFTNTIPSNIPIIKIIPIIIYSFKLCCTWEIIIFLYLLPYLLFIFLILSSTL